MRRSVPYLVLVLCLAVASACAHTPQAGGIRISDRVHFQGHDGKDVIRIEPTRAGIRVEDGTGKVLVGLRLLEENLAIEDPRGELVALVLPPSSDRRGYSVVSADRSEEICALRSEPDGDLTVYDSEATRLYEAKRRDYGFKVLDREGRTESKVRVRAEKISLRDPSGVTFLTTRDPFPPSSVAALAFEGLRFEYALGLSIALAHWPPAAD